MGGATVGHGDSTFRISDGFLEISGLRIDSALVLSGFIGDTNVELWGAWVVSLGVRYSLILIDFGSRARGSDFRTSMAPC